MPNAEARYAIATSGKVTSQVAQFRVTNSTRDAVLAAAAREASDPIRRGVGLMFRKDLPDGGGLIIRPCNGVVSFFMRFHIDVMFLSRDGTVCHLVCDMRPWRVSKLVKQSKIVVELPSGTLNATGTSIGDSITIERL